MTKVSGVGCQVSGVRKKVSVFSVQVSGNTNHDLTGLAWVEQRTAEPQNNEPQNFEGWNRYVVSFKSI
jgi:hypothetical protein